MYHLTFPLIYYGSTLDMEFVSVWLSGRLYELCEWAHLWLFLSKRAMLRAKHMPWTLSSSQVKPSCNDFIWHTSVPSQTRPSSVCEHHCIASYSTVDVTWDSWIDYWLRLIHNHLDIGFSWSKSSTTPVEKVSSKPKSKWFDLRVSIIWLFKCSI